MFPCVSGNLHVVIAQERLVSLPPVSPVFPKPVDVIPMTPIVITVVTPLTIATLITILTGTYAGFGIPGDGFPRPGVRAYVCLCQ